VTERYRDKDTVRQTERQTESQRDRVRKQQKDSKSNIWISRKKTERQENRKA
jgi:hypothetical protein